MDIIIGSLIGLIPALIIAAYLEKKDPSDPSKPANKVSRPLKWGSSKKF